MFPSPYLAASQKTKWVLIGQVLLNDSVNACTFTLKVPRSYGVEITKRLGLLDQAVRKRSYYYVNLCCTITLCACIACNAVGRAADSHDRAHMSCYARPSTTRYFSQLSSPATLTSPRSRNTPNIHGSLKPFRVSCYSLRWHTVALGLIPAGL